VTGYLHRRFLRHAERIGYPFEPLLVDDHPANGSFVPVIASLEAHDRMVRSAPVGTHPAEIRSENLGVCAAAATLGNDGR
jgi:hypothetical protein